ncbi:MAG: hypothetical protein K0S32_1122 [Bacteroidetes bacterium]|jgi:tetratricopeptide (TPR) repeat protein|nr:hypothetical protein [Bacteroidota bacterium]
MTNKEGYFPHHPFYYRISYFCHSMKKHFLLPLLFLCSVLNAQYGDKKFYLVDSIHLSEIEPAERYKLDSLLQVYQQAKHDTTRLQTLHRLTLLDNPDLWVRYNRKLIGDSKKLTLNRKANTREGKIYFNKLGSSYYNMNFYFSMINEEDSSLRYVKLCIEPFRIAGDQGGLADAYSSLGVYYSRQGNFAEALKNFQQCLVINESINDKSGIARALLSIGIAYRDIEEFDKALEYVKKSLKITEELGDERNLPDSWNQMGVAYKWSGDTLNAEKAYRKSLEYALKINNIYAVSVAKLNLGVLQQDRNNFTEAIKSFEESLAGFKKSKSTNGMSYALNSLAICYKRLNQPGKALPYAKEAHDINLQTGYPESLMNSSQVLGELYEQTGNFREAIGFQKYFYRTKDSLSGADAQKKALKTQLDFENEKKVLELKKEQESRNLIAAQEKKRDMVIIVAAIAGLIIVIIFAIVLYKRFKITNKQKDIIEKQNHLVTEKNKEILDSISYAKRLQEAILPPLKDVLKYLPGSFIFYKPKDIVAGDFFWMHTVENYPLNVKGSERITNNDQLILFAVADSTGHGVPGALVSVVCSNALNRSVNEFGLKDPGKILDKTRELVLETFEKSDKDVKDGMDISLISIQESGPSAAKGLPTAQQNSKEKIVQWAGANNPLWYFKNNEFFEIKPDKQPVGKSDKAKPFTTHTIELSKGDSVYLFTDGYADQFGGAQGKKYKYKPFADLLGQCHSMSPEQQHEKLKIAFEEWKGGLEQVDDVCVVGIKL